MKEANGVPSDVSADQKKFCRRVSNQGYIWFACFGHIQAEGVLDWYFGLRKNVPEGCIKGDTSYGL
jgi:hypothetical protein